MGTYFKTQLGRAVNLGLLVQLQTLRFQVSSGPGQAGFSSFQPLSQEQMARERDHAIYSWGTVLSMGPTHH